MPPTAHRPQALTLVGPQPIEPKPWLPLPLTPCFSPQAMDKLTLNDASVVVKRENSEALGPGFRWGWGSGLDEAGRGFRWGWGSGLDEAGRWFRWGRGSGLDEAGAGVQG